MTQQNQTKPAMKDLGVETLRGFAIILVVMGHVIGVTSQAGMEVSDDSLLRYFYFCLSDIRMPLFTVISGYVYSMRPMVRGGNLLQFFAGKARRILIPMVVVSTLEYLTKGLVQGGLDLPTMWHIYFYGYDHFWFLESILVIMTIAATLDYLGWLSRPELVGAVLVVSLLNRWHPLFFTTFFSIHSAFSLLPFFFLGCVLGRYEGQLRAPKITLVCLLAIVPAVAFRQLVWFHRAADLAPLTEAATLIVGACGTILLFRFRISILWLSMVGSYAYGIFLFHVFAEAGTLTMLHRLQVNDQRVLFTLSTIAAVTFPILLEHIARKHALARTLLFGLP